MAQKPIPPQKQAHVQKKFQAPKAATAQPQQVKAAPKKQLHTIFLFSRDNYRIMLAGLGILIVGFLLMVGGGSSDPNQFHPEQIYSWRRITLAPIVIFIGFLIEIYAIMKKPRPQ
jgi:hypothetical protein